MTVHEQVSLEPYNSFGISAHSAFFTEVKNAVEFWEASQFAAANSLPKLIIGGGSNILLTQDYSGLVIKNNLQGKSIVSETTDDIILRFMSGENWHEAVLWTLANNWYGLENLSLIPGTMGAAPMQNIGAYGVELKDVFHKLEALHLQSGETHTFNANDCAFGYRESVFKNKYKNTYFITAVELRLQKSPHIKADYGDIIDTLSKNNIALQDATPLAISKAVIAIRQSKLPDPKKLGNAGSFFKNPSISVSQFEALTNKFPDIKGYSQANEKVKVPAGWLIEQCGYKGKIVGNCGSHAKQALVLVNYGQAKGNEILALAKEIQETVFQKFGITIEPEVNII
jgi:UDP-N-acetylmuramate dehydrogenase